ncbi:MAG: vanadium-dependent haloperoxidase [Arcicella sp.]|nr:vanadium-dependent haloperoxidase [Arcicella sp.]
MKLFKLTTNQFKRPIQFLFIASTALWLDACKVKETDITPQEPPVDSSPANKFSSDVASNWAVLQQNLTKTTAGYTPPVAARAYAYGGLVMYEAAVGGLPNNQSLAGQLTNLTTLPKPETGKDYNWALSVNAAEATILRALYAESSLLTATKNKTAIDSLEVVNLNANKISVAQDVIDRSVKYGQDVANTIFEWSKTDGGHEGYKRNFLATYVVPVFPGSWQVTENEQRIPMQPTWGTNRSFVPANSNLILPGIIPFSASITSSYFSQYFEVYTVNKSLTAEQKEIAAYWADNPVETQTPAGHSYNIANIAIKQSKVGLGKAAETFAKTGITLNDAFINCWKCKFNYNNERPYTMIRRTIDANWKPLFVTPPFPGFPSGHSTQSGAVSEVLTDTFGQNFAFTDNTHEGRKDNTTGIVLKTRTYKSFADFSQEAAVSRLYGGIHPRMDNETGLAEGRKVGKNVLALKFKK